MVSVNLLAAAAALGIGCAATADVVTISQSFYNASFSSRTFYFTQYLNVAGGSPSAIMSGSISATLTDVNGNGVASISNAGGDPIYRALVNDTMVRSLWTTYSFSVNGAYLSQSTPAVATPGPTQSMFMNEALPTGVPADGTLAIELAFSLSAGDSVTFAATFNVVPAPGAIAMVAIAGGTAFGRRRRA